MTPEKLREILAFHNLSQHQAADALGVNPRTMQRWCSGDQPVSEPVRRILYLSVNNPGFLNQFLWAGQHLANGAGPGWKG